MKNLNENINRLRQIMSYDRSRGLLVNESQYSMEDDNGKKHVPFQGYHPFGDGKPLSDDERSRAEEIAKELYKSSRASYPDYMEPIDFSDIKTDAFYDHLMNTLGKLYKQEESGDSVVLDEQEETVSGVEAIANKIYQASKGLGTDETSFISAVKDIKSKDEFNQVDELLKATDFGDETQGFEYFVSDEMGGSSTEVSEILAHLKTIGVELSGYSEEKEEVASDPFDIEKIKSGEQFLKKGQGNESSETVTSVQELLITKMDSIGVTIDFEQSDLGNYGPKTAALVTAFQSMNNLKPDGIVGAKTIAALMG